VRLEPAGARGDHYDPQSRTVRLSASNYHGKSLTAVAVAAHEVGHALQDRQGYHWMRLRARLYPAIRTTEQIAVLVLYAIPVITLVLRTPLAGAIMLFAGVTFFLVRVGFHLLTLPVEWDASFARALPIIEQGRYIAPDEHGAVRRVLRAAALTYVAAALADILSFWRWLLILRGR